MGMGYRCTSCIKVGKSEPVVDPLVPMEAQKDVRKLARLGIKRAPFPKCPSAATHRRPVPVYLNVYDLIDRETNDPLATFGLGIFHAGVEIYGLEYSFGEIGDTRTGTGIFVVGPGQALSTHKHKICIGETIITTEQLRTLVCRMKVEWRATSYHILDKNCNDFAVWFCCKLSTIQALRVPDWINRAARWGNLLLPKKFASWICQKYDEAAQNIPTSNCGKTPERSDIMSPAARSPTLKFQDVVPRPQLASGATTPVTLDLAVPKPGTEGGRISMPNFNAARASHAQPTESQAKAETPMGGQRSYQPGAILSPQSTAEEENAKKNLIAQFEEKLMVLAPPLRPKHVECAPPPAVRFTLDEDALPKECAPPISARAKTPPPPPSEGAQRSVDKPSGARRASSLLSPREDSDENPQSTAAEDSPVRNPLNEIAARGKPSECAAQTSSTDSPHDAKADER